MPINRKLLEAAQTGDFPEIAALIENGADVNYSETIQGRLQRVLSNALMSESTERNEILKLLLKNQANVNETSSHLKYTPLHWACEWNDTELVQLLLEHKADVHALDSSGKKPVKHTSKKEIRRLLNQKGEKTAEHQDSLDRQLYIAAANASLTAIKKLVWSGANTEFKSRGKTALMILLTPSDINGRISNKAVEAFKWLIEKGYADINTSTTFQDTLLHQACALDRVDLVKYLIRKGTAISINKDKDTVLHAAVRHTYNINEKLWHFLINTGLDINAENAHGETPLIAAVSSGNFKAMKFLMNKGADLTLKDKKNRTALDIARYHGIKKMIRSLENKRRRLVTLHSPV